MVIVLTFLIPGYFQPHILCLMMAIIAFLSAQEFRNATKKKDLDIVSIVPFLTMLSSCIPVFVHIFTNNILWAFSIYILFTVNLSLFLVIFVVIFHKKEMAFIDALSAGVILLYSSFPFACANLIALFVPNGWYFFVLGLGSPWISDVFAFFTGTLFGRHKIVPRISPKKTWEGCIGGAAFCSLITTLYFYFMIFPLMEEGRVSRFLILIFAIGLGLYLSVVSQLGDWLASTVKRWANIKDFGNVLPGHGGILDRFDSAFFTLPTIFALTLFFMLRNYI